LLGRQDSLCGLAKSFPNFAVNFSLQREPAGTAGKKAIEVQRTDGITDDKYRFGVRDRHGRETAQRSVVALESIGFPGGPRSRGSQPARGAALIDLDQYR